MNVKTYDEIQIGDSASFSVTISQEDLDSFLKTTKDNNPLHTDLDYAKSQGFKDCVCYGMLTASFYSTLVGVYLPGKFAIFQGIDTTFNAPVFPGDSLTIEGSVSYKNDSFKLIEVKASIKNQDGKKVSKAKLKVGVLK